MSLNLVKLCVGLSSVEELTQWIDINLAERKARGGAEAHIHTTRMVPKRVDELLDGGSLYWVMKGNIQCRQRLLGIQPFTDNEGVKRCHFLLEPTVIETVWQPRRAFQGWRYLSAEDAPRDVAQDGLGELPADLRQELTNLGLL